MLVGWYEGVLRPENSHINKLQAKEATVAASLASLQDRYIGLIDAKRRVPAERVALAKLEHLVPEGPDLDSLVKVLFNETAEAGAQLVSIGSPAPAGFGSGSGAATGAQGPNQLLLTVGVSGSASQVERLYRLLDSNSRLFVIDNCSLSFPTAAVRAAQATGSSPGDESTIDIRAFFVSPNPNSAVS
jgi:hypothetical protein